MALKPDNKNKKFSLEKWFLDLVTEDGETQIFYAAKLIWRGISVPYSSHLWLTKSKQAGQKARFYETQLPEVTNNIVKYNDTCFRIEGTWMANTSSVNALIFDSDEGDLKWNCIQPSSTAVLKTDKKEFNGLGYAEKITLTVYPWKLAMHQLRWGRFVSAKDYLVWIEVKSETIKQWIWYNGEKINEAQISDEEVLIPSKNILLRFTDTTTIESENKINNVVKRLIQFLPGFHKLMPVEFLMAREVKWRSRGILKNGDIESRGWIIHELVNFKT